MNLIKMFEKQKELQRLIDKKHPLQPGENRKEKYILALLTEVGELGNEWRGFKFWSVDQKPRTKKARRPYVDLEDAEFYNPVLEEYVDGFHFALDLGILAGKERLVKEWEFEFPEGENNVNSAFLRVYNSVLFFDETNIFTELISDYISLGASLGFTWEEIEACYYEKHAINIKRQEENY